MKRNAQIIPSKPPAPLAGDLDHILIHTESLWEALRGRRVFITGGTGFFGCWLLESFAYANDRLDLGASAVVLTRSYDAFQSKAPHLACNPAIKCHIGDIRDFDFPEGEFSHIIHAATSPSTGRRNEDHLFMFDTIVEGTRHTLDFAVYCRAKKFLLTSSGAVYGKQPSDMAHMPEDYCGSPDLTDPYSAYGEGKRAAELLCTLYAEQFRIETKIARCFAFVGPYLPLDIHYAIGNFIRDGLNGGPILVNGDGTPCRSYLYAADLAIWLWTILFRGQSCFPYNVGAEDIVTIAQLAHLVARCVGTSIEVRITKMQQPGRPLERYVPSTKRATLLGLTSFIDLKQAVAETLKFNQGLLHRG